MIDQASCCNFSHLHPWIIYCGQLWFYNFTNGIIIKSYYRDIIRDDYAVLF